MTSAGAASIPVRLSTVHFQHPQTGQFVNALVIAVEGTRVLVACKPEVGGVTKLDIDSTAFGVLWVPVTLLLPTRLALLVAQFSLPESIEVDRVLGLCLALGNVSDLSSSESWKPSSSTQNLFTMFSQFSTQTSSTLAQQQNTIYGLASRLEAPSPSSTLGASAPTTPALPKGKLQLGSRLQSAKAAFWEGSDDEESVEDDESGGDESEDLNAQFTLLTEETSNRGKPATQAGPGIDQVLSSTSLTPEHLHAMTQVKILKQLGKTSKMRHTGLQETIWMLLEDKPLHAIAFACQWSKALDQVALDQGDWPNAVSTIPVADLLAGPHFGGDEHEVQMIHSYKKAMKELKTKHSVGERLPAPVVSADHVDGKEAQSA